MSKQKRSSGDPGSSGVDPNAPLVPPVLITLGKFFLRNIDMVYMNYMNISMFHRMDVVPTEGIPRAACVEP